MNVWFTQDWIDPLSTVGNTTGAGLAQFLHDVPGLGPAVSPALDAAVRATPAAGLGMRGFYDWLAREPAVGSPLGTLLSAAPTASWASTTRAASPAASAPSRTTRGCATGWCRWRCSTAARTTCSRASTPGAAHRSSSASTPAGASACSASRDEHGTDWGYPDGKGRTGLYVKELTRTGVHEAMDARRFFSTRLRGLRFGAAMAGVGWAARRAPRRPRALRRSTSTAVRRWSASASRCRSCMTGRPLPTVVHTQRITVPEPGRLLTFDAPVDAEDGRWVVLRLTDPAGKADARASSAYTAGGEAIAYAAPFFLEP